MREPPKPEIGTFVQFCLNLAILIFDGRTYQNHLLAISLVLKSTQRHAMNRGGGTTACVCSVVYAAGSAGYDAPGSSAKRGHEERSQFHPDHSVRRT